MRIAFRTALLVAVVVSGAAVSAMAAITTFTPINPPVGEESHQRIFSYIYGGTFNPTGPLGLDFTNGQITATRIPDLYENEDNTPRVQLATSLVGEAGVDDRLWLADFRQASAEAKFAVYSQNFGYYDGPTDMTYHKLFDQTGWGYQVNGEADLDDLGGNLLRWARGGEGRIVSSNPVDNLDGRDHMVTYRIDFEQEVPRALPSQTDELTVWLLFWEDKFEGEHLADFDFNDLAVEVTASPLLNLPEPGSAALLAFGLLALAARRHAK